MRPETLSRAHVRKANIPNQIEDFQTRNINMPLRQTAP